MGGESGDGPTEECRGDGGLTGRRKKVWVAGGDPCVDRRSRRQGGTQRGSRILCAV